MTSMTVSHFAGCGGRQRARRSLVRAALVAALCVFIAPAAAGQPAATDSLVSVTEDQGLYSVSARFMVIHPAAVVFAVLTDYEAIPRFMPGVRFSVVLERREGGALVEQEAVARLLMFSKRIHLVLDVREDPGAIRFEDRCTRSFTHYKGSWTMTERDGETAIGYELAARPAFDMPEFLLKKLLKRDAVQMIEHLRAEIGARSAATPPR